MSLSTALSIAQSALRNTSRQTSVVSRNVSDASNPDYTRRTRWSPAPRPARARSTSSAPPTSCCSQNNLGALSSLDGQRTLYDGMERLGLAVNGADNASSAATAHRQAAAGAADLFGLAVQPQPGRERRRRGPPGRAHAEQRHATRSRPSAPTWIPRSAPSVDELNDLLAAVQGRQQRHRLRHAQRPRRLRCARPARRTAQADIEHRRRSRPIARRTTTWSS